LKVTKYIPPTRERPRRIQVDGDGVVWFCEYTDGKIGRFDPEKERFTEFPLPHPRSAPYALGIAPDRTLWYSAEHRDVIGRLDPETGKVTEFPMPMWTTACATSSWIRPATSGTARRPTTGSAISICLPASATPTRGKGPALPAAVGKADQGRLGRCFGVGP
jgi:sugar lactone lactonase YvrE